MSATLPCIPRLIRKVAVPAHPPGPVLLVPSKLPEPLMGLIGINGTGKDTLVDCATDRAGNNWRLAEIEFSDY